MEAVGVEVLNQKLACGPDFFAYRLEPELPKQMFLEGFGPGEDPFDEFMLSFGILVAAPPYKSGVRGVFKIGFLFFGRGAGFVKGKGAVIFEDFQGGITLKFFGYLLPEINDRQFHQLY
jgi:hypothetical protein